MTDFKFEAAGAAFQLIKAGQTIGLGAGTTISHVVKMISDDTSLSASLILTSSSFKTMGLLQKYGLSVQHPSLLNNLDIYFDGCDQFDAELNALKSGGGIHTTEKILASMADEFILIGDDSKFSEKLDNKHPLVVEVLPQALQAVLSALKSSFPGATINLRAGDQKDGAVISDNGNMLADIYFEMLPPPEKLNTQIKMMPGVIDHSLFYRMATKAIIAGKDGISIITPNY